MWKMYAGFVVAYLLKSLRGSQARRKAHSRESFWRMGGACFIRPAWKSKAAPTPMRTDFICGECFAIQASCFGQPSEMNVMSGFAWFIWSM